MNSYILQYKNEFIGSSKSYLSKTFKKKGLSVRFHSEKAHYKAESKESLPFAIQVSKQEFKIALKRLN